MYGNYTDMFGVGYDVLYDFESPPYFYPPQCGKAGSFVLNGTESRIIAIVGDNNTVSEAVLNYLQVIFDY